MIEAQFKFNIQPKESVDVTQFFFFSYLYDISISVYNYNIFNFSFLYKFLLHVLQINQTWKFAEFWKVAIPAIRRESRLMFLLLCLV